MKHSNHIFRYFAPIVVLFLIMTSCNSTKYAALPCPDLPQVPKTKEIKVPKNNKIFSLRLTKNNNTRINRRKARNNSNLISPTNQIKVVNDYNVVSDLPSEESTANIIPFPQIGIQSLPPPSEEYYINLIKDVESRSSALEANYHKMKSLSTYIPRQSTSEAKILKSTNSYQEAIPQVEGLGIAGFVAGIVGLLIFSIPLGTVAIVFGAVSLAKIKKNPNRFSGKGLAVASLTLGIIDIAALVILLLIL